MDHGRVRVVLVVLVVVVVVVRAFPLSSLLHHPTGW
jgi:hypothetical protein